MLTVAARISSLQKRKLVSHQSCQFLIRIVKRSYVILLFELTSYCTASWTVENKKIGTHRRGRNPRYIEPPVGCLPAIKYFEAKLPQNMNKHSITSFIILFFLVRFLEDGLGLSFSISRCNVEGILDSRVRMLQDCFPWILVHPRLFDHSSFPHEILCK